MDLTPGPFPPGQGSHGGDRPPLPSRESGPHGARQPLPFREGGGGRCAPPHENLPLSASSAPGAVADLVSAIATLLIADGQTLGVAESSTGGLLGHWLTDRPGASRWFLGGVIAYHNRLKTALLGAPAALFDRSDASAGGTVSAATARALALGARQRLQCDWAVAETGLAGAHPGRSRKPIGLSYIAVAGPGAAAGGQPRVWTAEHQFEGSRSANKAAAAHAALHLLHQALVEAAG